MHKLRNFGLTSVFLLNVLSGVGGYSEQLYLANGKSWPGSVFVADQGAYRNLFTRMPDSNGTLTPRVQSVTGLPGGRLVFCSGLDRSILEWSQAGERVINQGGYLARQVRTDTNGDLYWSGLETPLNTNPLPDGFIYRWNEAQRQAETVLTFSQLNTQRDWWGAFDVRDSRIYVATLRAPTTIYEVVDSIPRELYRLPIGATAFRFRNDGSLDACDGQGKLYHFPDPTDSQNYSVILDSPVPFVDFSPAPERT